MSHTDAGHYAAKHASDTVVNPAITQAVIDKSREGKISCADAHHITADLGVPPATVGIAIDLLEIRIIACQLGLFAKREQSHTPMSADEVPAALTDALHHVQQAGRLTCLEAWTIAAQQGLPRAMVGQACDALELKIVKCQLGTF